MPDGESIDELFAGLEFDTFGMGLTHMLLHVQPEPACTRCWDTHQVGHPLFPIPCPDCVQAAT